MTRSYLRLIERAHNGPLVRKDDWELEKVVTATRQLVKKYQIE